MTREVEQTLIDLIDDIVGEEHLNEELQRVLGISADLENVEVALMYTKGWKNGLTSVTFKDFENIEEETIIEKEILVIVTSIGPIKSGPFGSYCSICMKDLQGESGLLILNGTFLEKVEFLKTFKLKGIRKFNVEDKEDIMFRCATVKQSSIVKTDDYEKFSQVKL